MILLLLLLFAACSPPPGDGDNRASACAEGYVSDGDACVPETCGTGRWGTLPVDDATVFVSLDADDGGSGSEDAPLPSIQAALDLAGARGGGLVAISAGTYPETLVLDSTHANVRLAGRCRELVEFDASVGEEGIPGIEIDTGFGEVVLSGVSIVGSTNVGVLVRSGDLRLVGSSVRGSEHYGIAAYREDTLAPTTLQVEGCEIAQNTLLGVTAWDSGTRIELLDTVVRGTLPVDGSWGYGVHVADGAALAAEGCEISGNTTLGIAVLDPGSEVTLTDTVVRDTSPEGSGARGHGLKVWSGASLEAVGCEVVGNTAVGVRVGESGSRISLADTRVADTRFDEQEGQGFGVLVWGGAELRAESCEVVGNRSTGVLAKEAGTRVSLLDVAILDTLPHWGGDGGSGIGALWGADVRAEGCEIHGNRSWGIKAYDPGTTVSLVDSSVTSTRADEHGEHGAGLEINSGAALEAVGCEIAENTEVGLRAAFANTLVTLVDTTIRDTVPTADGAVGSGILSQDAASITAVGCEISGSTGVAIMTWGQDTLASLVDTVVRDTVPDGQGEFGYGLQVSHGAMLTAQGCELSGHTRVGVMVVEPGAAVFLEDTIVRDTNPSGHQDHGIAAEAQSGSMLIMTGCEIAGSTSLGIMVDGEGTLATLTNTVVRDTHPIPSGDLGNGIQVSSGAVAVVEGCEITNCTQSGITAYESGTEAIVRDSTISGITASHGELGLAAVGLSAVQGATVSASGLLGELNEGPALLAESDGTLSCSGCTLRGNRFAGAVVVEDGSLRIEGSRISDTLESADLGGGVGVFASRQTGLESPSLVVQDSTIADNQVAGVWLAGDGGFVLSGNQISGSAALPFGPTHRCGDGVFASGTASWDGTEGLQLSENTITGNEGSGLFLHDAQAALEGNSWSGNDPDLWVQGQACSSPSDDWDDAPDNEICPTWSRPPCDLVFTQELQIVEVDSATSQAQPTAPKLSIPLALSPSPWGQRETAGPEGPAAPLPKESRGYFFSPL